MTCLLRSPGSSTRTSTFSTSGVSIRTMDLSLLRFSCVRSLNTTRTLPSAYAVYQPSPSALNSSTTSIECGAHMPSTDLGTSSTSAAVRNATSLGVTFPIGTFPTANVGANLPYSSIPSAASMPSGTGSPVARNTPPRYPPAPATVAGTASERYIAAFARPPRSSATYNTQDPPLVVTSAEPSSMLASASIRCVVGQGTASALERDAFTAHITVPSASSTTGARPVAEGNPSVSGSAHQRSSPSFNQTRLVEVGSSSPADAGVSGRTVTGPIAAPQPVIARTLALVRIFSSTLSGFAVSSSKPAFASSSSRAFNTRRSMG
mmetsp:Transcript_4491/g.20382  ORF Transcript_4491/g.20382 Transcript_4491/m.20382 type:complete len:320 (+) Transcript_4491:3169-4128(+)